MGHKSASALSVVAFDIETTCLDPDFGAVLCACWQSSDERKVRTATQRVVNPVFASDRGDDRAVVTELCSVLERHAVWVAHNGTFFDVPFLRRRCLALGLPPLRVQRVVDPFLLAKRYLCVGRNSLAALSSVLPNVPGKTGVTARVWRAAALSGSVPAMETIEKHCRRDVEALVAVSRLLSLHLGLNSGAMG